MAHIHRYKQNKPEKAILQHIHFNNVSPAMFNPGLPKPKFDYNRNFVFKSNPMSVDDKISFWDLIGSRDFLAKNPTTTEEKIDKIVRIEVKSSQDDIKMYHTKMKVRYNSKFFIN